MPTITIIKTIVSKHYETRRNNTLEFPNLGDFSFNLFNSILKFEGHIYFVFKKISWNFIKVRFLLITCHHLETLRMYHDYSKLI